MHRPLVYLAVPYTHSDGSVVKDRVAKVNAMTAKLMKLGHSVFSPITQSHYVAEQCHLPTNWEYWAKFDRDFISCCHTLYVLMLDGWDKSVGVTAEIAIAKEFGINIIYLSEHEENLQW